eukprot:TRINITY_DN8208_c0_g1_i1.p1 TRINITY_DN8208_c0_g1~~TRINITY_DN8208_c0_g1_i1.p1  ORF type:complete len:697 (+),score=109.43 TRINITY_DN8208_c0_g1_i1:86-2176(+)
MQRTENALVLAKLTFTALFSVGLSSTCTKPDNIMDQTAFTSYLECLAKPESCGNLDSSIFATDVCQVHNACDSDARVAKGCSFCAAIPAGQLSIEKACPKMCKRCGSNAESAINAESTTPSLSSPTTISATSGSLLTQRCQTRVRGEKLTSLLAMLKNRTDPLSQYDRPPHGPNCCLDPNHPSATSVATSWGIRHITPPSLGGTFMISGELTTFWYDSRLAWLPAEFGDACYIILEGQLPFPLWTPAIGMDTEIEERVQLTSWFRIESYGLVVWGRKVNFYVKCGMAMQRYPFDSQVCPVKIESFSNENIDVVLRKPLPEEPIQALVLTFDPETQSIGDYTLAIDDADVVATTVEYYGYMVSSLQYTFHFTRNWRKYVITVFVPLQFLVFTSFAGLFLDMDAVPARAALATVPTMSLVALMVSYRSSLPLVSYPLHIEIYFLVSILITILNAVEFALVNYSQTQIKRRKRKAEQHEELIGQTGIQMRIIGFDDDDAENPYDTGTDESGHAESVQADRHGAAEPQSPENDAAELGSNMIDRMGKFSHRLTESLENNIGQRRLNKLAQRERCAWRADLKDLIADLEFLEGGHLQRQELVGSIMRLGIDQQIAEQVSKKVEISEKGHVRINSLFSLLEKTPLVRTKRPRSIVCCGIGVSQSTLQLWEDIYRFMLAPSAWLMFNIIWFILETGTFADPER